MSSAIGSLNNQADAFFHVNHPHSLSTYKVVIMEECRLCMYSITRFSITDDDLTTHSTVPNLKSKANVESMTRCLLWEINQIRLLVEDYRRRKWYRFSFSSFNTSNTMVKWLIENPSMAPSKTIQWSWGTVLHNVIYDVVSSIIRISEYTSLKSKERKCARSLLLYHLTISSQNFFFFFPTILEFFCYLELLVLTGEKLSKWPVTFVLLF